MVSLTSLYTDSVSLKVSDNLQQAEETGLEFVEMATRVYGKEHPDVLNGLTNLADIRVKMGKFEDAREIYQTTLETHECVQSGGSREASEILKKLALIFDRMGEPDEGMACLERIVEMNVNMYGEEHPEVATSLNALAVLRMQHREYDLALPMFEKSLAIREKEYGRHHPHVATALNNLAVVFEKQGKYDTAQPLYERALDIRKTVFGAEHNKTRQSEFNLEDLQDKKLLEACLSQTITAIQDRQVKAELAQEEMADLIRTQNAVLEKISAKRTHKLNSTRGDASNLTSDSKKRLHILAARMALKNKRSNSM
mmetsp:Transcript_26447/g.57465  ORF Transcript_26447/g.57465 Transcript_26447/m.57465 type:complete len:312 (-) Transcript_26447:107-1042(-)|eukprot:CAMPEP_0118935056 /NCGR_PEP_ID=MMETSP1169-20130426/14829_1 /TAXON_ID=36882 /ORGANISM="Pyramimonas obovata, Strain CCMP722" /LENGTH=311 /DNA_ID=CAMNT_0006878039 /DNA_START=168 /DNA_END=1103 /DNA_ORIENTATION=-